MCVNMRVTCFFVRKPTGRKKYISKKAEHVIKAICITLDSRTRSIGKLTKLL